MGLFETGSVKSDKANAMKKFRTIRQIAKLFRVLEVCVSLFLISRFYSLLPTAVRTSGDYFRLFCGVLVSPMFVFVFGNAIIITLVFKSGHFSGGKVCSSGGGDLYDEFVKSSENRSRTSSNGYGSDEIVFEDKAVCVEHKGSETKTYRRCESDGAVRLEKKDVCRQIRKAGSFCGNEGKPSEFSEPAAMSNEEFRRTIDAFIAKQTRFRREESLSIVLQNKR